MTVARLRREISNEEFVRWNEFYKLQDEEAEKRVQEQRSRSRPRGRRGR